MSNELNRGRRRLLGAAAMALAADFATTGSAAAARPETTGSTTTSFASVKQIDAGVLNVGYAEAGLLMVDQYSCCTAGPTTFTRMST